MGASLLGLAKSIYYNYVILSTCLFLSEKTDTPAWPKGRCGFFKFKLLSNLILRF